MNKIKEYPIIFSVESIPKLLDGKISLTHRLKGLDHINESPDDWEIRESYLDCISRHKDDFAWTTVFGNKKTGEIWEFNSSYGEIGSVLWVREPWCYKQDSVTLEFSDNEYWYFATTPNVEKFDDDGFPQFNKNGWQASPWLSPIHMPRKASRINLKKTASKLHRLKDITIEEIIATGIATNLREYDAEVDLKEKFAKQWDKWNAKSGNPWDKNPWVEAVSIKKF